MAIFIVDSLLILAIAGPFFVSFPGFGVIGFVKAFLRSHMCTLEYHFAWAAGSSWMDDLRTHKRNKGGVDRVPEVYIFDICPIPHSIPNPNEHEIEESFAFGKK